LVQFRTDDVFELAGLRLRFGILNGKSVLEEPFSQAVTADHVARALAAHGSELHFPVLHLHQAQIGHARKHSRGRLLAYHRQTPRWPAEVKASLPPGLAFLPPNPNLLEEMVKPDFVIGGNRSATVRRVRE